MATMNSVSATGIGAAMGTVSFASAMGGASVRVSVKGLPAGVHGFHIHEGGSCAPGLNNGAPAAAMAAGGHFDPTHAHKHMGPSGEGHLGDLPPLTVGADGSAEVTLTAPRIRDIDTLRGHAIVIHAGGDNFSDQPAPLGGGGARIACGVIG